MRLGMHEFRRNLGQWTQDKTETQYIRPRQSDRRFVQYQIIIEQQIDIERSRRISSRCPAPVSCTVYFLYLIVDFDRREPSLQADDHIEEIIAVEAVCLASIHGGLLELAESFLELFEPQAQIFLRLDIAANT